jgi:hypothetical protein
MSYIITHAFIARHVHGVVVSHIFMGAPTLYVLIVRPFLLSNLPSPE